MERRANPLSQHSGGTQPIYTCISTQLPVHFLMFQVSGSSGGCVFDFIHYECLNASAFSGICGGLDASTRGQQQSIS